MCGSNHSTDSEDPQEVSDLLRCWEYNLYLLGKSRRRVPGGNSVMVMRSPPVFTPYASGMCLPSVETDFQGATTPLRHNGTDDGRCWLTEIT
ncbi:hypothetical protein HPB50_021075 [Hyalomma asiaticum]|uniref:Uncharacterized protein n=1 Tax=Hyalomma asiaticum TaxID=266040 RepID=A0ACB7S7N0_HYAAI|nr:hypothetical protein HPB50_021075 [Hyalomma asiaticum]